MLAALLAVTFLAALVIVALVCVIWRLLASHAKECEALRLEATDERRELLTRLQHPQLIVTKAPEQQVAQPAEPDDAEEWAKVGQVQPTVVADDEPDPEDA